MWFLVFYLEAKLFHFFPSFMSVFCPGSNRNNPTGPVERNSPTSPVGIGCVYLCSYGLLLNFSFMWAFYFLCGGPCTKNWCHQLSSSVSKSFLTTPGLLLFWVSRAVNALLWPLWFRAFSSSSTQSLFTIPRLFPFCCCSECSRRTQKVWLLKEGRSSVECIRRLE